MAQRTKNNRIKAEYTVNRTFQRSDVEGPRDRVMDTLARQANACLICNVRFTDPADQAEFDRLTGDEDETDDQSHQPLGNQMNNDQFLANALAEMETVVPLPCGAPASADTGNYLPPPQARNPRSATSLPVGNGHQGNVLTNEQVEFLESIVPQPCLLPGPADATKRPTQNQQQADPLQELYDAAVPPSCLLG